MVFMMNVYNGSKRRVSPGAPTAADKKTPAARQFASPGARRFGVPKVGRQTRLPSGAPAATDTPSEANPQALRIIPLGGCEEVGRNMTVYEHGSDIVILDMGLQFPEEDMPGIDYIIPNIKYLQGKEKRIRGVVFSHGHLDHIGAAPILLEKLGYPPVIAMPLTLALIKHKQEDYQKGSAKRLKTVTVKSVQDRIQLGSFGLRFFQVEHSIMDSMGTILQTAAGTVVHPGDWTMERDRNGLAHVRYEQLANLPRPMALMLESLGATNEKRHGTYEEMYENLHRVLDEAPGRVIIATFSSQVERVKWIIEAATKLGKKVALDGYSMKMNIEMTKKLGYVKIQKGVLIDTEEADRYPENKVVIVCTGAQGEERAVLSRISSGEHRVIKLRKKDTVIFSSSIIPGNERTVQRLKDNIYRQSDRVIHGDIMDVHVSGHGTRRDIVDMLDQVKPDYFIPVYANHYFLKESRTLAIQNGFREGNVVVPDNGTVIELTRQGLKVLPKKVPTDYVFVDGLGISDTQHIVLRDRQVLAEDGMVVVIATVDSKRGTLVQNPDIITRGFVFIKDNKQLIEDIRHRVKKMVLESDPLTWTDTNKIKNDVRDKIGQFIFTKTQKRPMVLPVVIEV
ncbi:MAG: Ribocuclease J [Candidatus Magasanikbacteria bacterium GW2011_GWA2_56_11]|uniref:Ribocuclease J n=1 Tax=Candidatus Magasanikbacteria bacterium GW2011_GWA2_56_11 TaxID=1619044 RepID=A0A0G1YH74_9BACT|nr:MAG: Ribocuclease J [Candidatus Magasanikbacteria bacterium GW2011_GWA2_56_11]